MIEGIAASIIAAIIVGAVVWLAKKARRKLSPEVVNRPEFHIEMRMGPCSSTSGSGNNIKMTWSYIISIYNETKHDALNTTFSFDLGTLKYRLNEQPCRHLRGLETHNLTIEVEQEHTRETVLAQKNRFRDLLPVELRQLTITFKYANEEGSDFICIAKNNDGDVMLSYAPSK